MKIWIIRVLGLGTGILIGLAWSYFHPPEPAPSKVTIIDSGGAKIKVESERRRNEQYQAP